MQIAIEDGKPILYGEYSISELNRWQRYELIESLTAFCYNTIKDLQSDEPENEAYQILTDVIQKAKNEK